MSVIKWSWKVPELEHVNYFSDTLKTQDLSAWMEPVV